MMMMMIIILMYDCEVCSTVFCYIALVFCQLQKTSTVIFSESVGPFGMRDII